MLWFEGGPDRNQDWARVLDVSLRGDHQEDTRLIAELEHCKVNADSMDAPFINAGMDGLSAIVIDYRRYHQQSK